MLSHLLRTTWGLVGAVLAGLVVLFVVGLFLVRPQPPPKPSTDPDRPHDEVVDQAQDLLARANDPTACRSALQQLNVRLGRQPEHRAEPLTDAQRQLLLDPKQLGLSPGELAEVENPRFTQLDAHHVDLCFLLHDVALSLDLEGLSQPAKAGAAFAWVVRQVRPLERDEELLAPEFVLHRGWGTARQRALLFVNLLEQLDIPGCVLALPAAENELLRPWACGALTTLPGGKQEVLLFDPRLGLPLPGPQGTAPELTAAFRLALPVHGGGDQQPATLAALRRQPDLLGALTADDKHPYDVGARELEGSRLYLVGMLSALAPRMKYLQEELPAARSAARLSYDPAAARAAWKAVAAGLGGPAPEVRFWKEATRAEFRSWPPEEGGTDTAGRLAQKVAELIAWRAFPPQVAELQGEPRKRLQSLFNRSFVEFSFNPGMPPDLVLHGRFDEATRALVEARDQLREQKARLAAATGVDEKVLAWCAQVVEVQADLNRAEREAARGRDPAARGAVDEARGRLDAVWKEGAEVLSVLVEGRTAEVMLPDVTYLLALCKQEQAERLQLRLDGARRGDRPASEADVQAAREAWTDASSWWGQYAGDLAATGSAEQPAQGLTQSARRGSAPAARLLHARAHEALGEDDDAVRLLRDLSGGLTGLDETARLYLARRLKKP